MLSMESGAEVNNEALVEDSLGSTKVQLKMYVTLITISVNHKDLKSI